MADFYTLRPHGSPPRETVDTVVMILSCAATNDRREACRETWLSHHLPDGMKVVFLVGRPGQQSVLSGDILYLDCPDTYAALPQKTWAGIRECLQRWPLAWLWKVDDDTFCVPLRLKEYPKHHHYLGRPVATRGMDGYWHHSVVPGKEKIGPIDRPGWSKLVKDNGWHGPWASGMAYCLSRHACELVAAEPLTHVQRELYEDAFVGNVLRSYNIHLYGKQQTLRYVGESLYGATAIHPCPPAKMREVFWRMLRAGEMGT